MHNSIIKPLSNISSFNILLKNNTNGIPLFYDNMLINCISSYVKEYVENKNPRNLERLTIARKPTGFHLEKPGRTFWHKLIFIRKPRHVAAKVLHNNGNIIIQASTNEWGINRHLYKCNDVSAYVNLAKILAERCLESGIYYMINGIELNSEKCNLFVKHLEEGGIVLSEPSTYSPLTPWSTKMDEKPWKIHLNKAN